MFKIIFACITFFAVGHAVAQTYHTPDKIQFGNLHLNLSEGLRREIQAEVEALTRSPKYLNIKLDRAKIYFPIIERVFREENLPEDFKYLVLQESALIPDAVSTSNAIGFWQFKEPAAREVGLQLDGPVDERMNIVSATRGAARYLKKNNLYFDNWLYALIAYYAGRGGAQNHVDSRYYGAKRMNLDKSLHWYAKKFLAHKIAFETALANYPAGEIYLYEFNQGSNKTLSEIAREFAVNEDELLAYNKWLKRGRIPSDKQYTVVIPMKYGSAQDMIAKTEDKSRSEKYMDYDLGRADEFPVIEKFKGFDVVIVKINGKEGVIAKENDNIRSLALIGNLSTDEFRKINDLDEDDQAKSGHFYYFQKKRNKAKTHYHILQPGEDLWHVSQKYGIKLKKLLQKNRLKDESEAKPGLILWLRFIRPRNHPVEYGPVKQPAEAIAQKTGVKPRESVEKDAASNSGQPATGASSETFSFSERPEPQPIPSPPGETSPVAGERQTHATERNQPEANPAPPTRQNLSVTHVVKQGETLFALSRKYNVSVAQIKRWNDMGPEENLRTGQELIIETAAVTASPDVLPEENRTKSYMYHKVEAGDTLYKIAREYNVTIKELMDWNDKSDFNVQINEVIKILK